MARSGLTETEIAAELKINPSTLTRWKQKYPDIVQALNESRNFVDSLVEDSLLKRALGYEYEEAKMVATQDGKTRRVEKTKRAVPPDVTAQIFWLKNRQPDKWRDKREHELTGKDGEKLFDVVVVRPPVSGDGDEAED